MLNLTVLKAIEQPISMLKIVKNYFKVLEVISSLNGDLE